jgi:hypothetical protein
VVHGLAWLALGLACWIAPRSWQDKPGAARGPRAAWRRFSRGNAAERQASRRRLLDINAFYWLAARGWFKPAQVWFFLAASGLLWGWGGLAFRGDWFNAAVYLATGLVLNSVLKCWVASEAGRRISEDRQAGALELLLATPFTVREILTGQWLALARQFLWPVLLVLTLEGVMLGAMVRGSDFDHDLVVAWVAGMVMMVADLATLPWVGMWMAVSARHPNQVSSQTVARILVLPWLFFILIISALSLFLFLANANYDPDSMVVAGLWLGIGVAVDLIFGFLAWRRLHTRFRTLAFERFTPRPGRLARLFRSGKASAA